MLIAAAAALLIAAGAISLTIVEDVYGVYTGNASYLSSTSTTIDLTVS